MGWAFKTRREELMGTDNQKPRRGNTFNHGPASEASRRWVMGAVQFAPADPRVTDPHRATYGSAFQKLEARLIAAEVHLDALRNLVERLDKQQERIAGLEEIVTKMAELLEAYDGRLRALEAPAKARAIKFERRPR
jgi:hypothetical protein